MFAFETGVRLVSVDIDYLEALYNADHEVQYSATGYENKKFLGVLIRESSMRYVIPLTSAKEKHKHYRNAGDTYLFDL